MGALEEYFSALNRLLKNEPLIVPRGSKINKDTVALEAGRKRGSIKASRKSFEQLIAAIESARLSTEPKDKTLSHQVNDKKIEIKQLKREYLRSLNREIMLNRRVRELENMLEPGNVVSINRKI